jgi:hypothetical protein
VTARRRDPLDRLALDLLAVGASYVRGRRTLGESTDAIKRLLRTTKRPTSPKRERASRVSTKQ